MPQLILTAVGPDRPGIVGELTAYLHASGGNILDSRMVNLRGEFAMMILIDLPEGALTKLITDVTTQGERMNLRLTTTPQQTGVKPVEGMRYRLKTYSMDQPGIVARLTGVLRALGVNIEELSARQDSAPFAGDPLFLTEMRLTIPRAVPLGQLRRELEAVGNELNCDIDLDPAE